MSRNHYFFRLCAFALPVLGILANAQQAVGENWGHWRGPTGNGSVASGNPPTRWTESTGIKWKTAIPGRGSGSPIVWNNQIFVVSAVTQKGSNSENSNSRNSGRRRQNATGLGKTKFMIFCIDRKSGTKIWEQTATEETPHQGVHGTNNFASASPCTDGKHVYAFFGSRGLFCFTIDGKPVWQRNDFGKMNTRNGFGEGSSPTLAGDKILVPWDHDGPSAIYALNKYTGATLWKTDREEPTNWSTPLVVPHNGKKQVILNGQNYARAYDLETGQELWRCGGQTQRPCASAVAADGLVFVGSGFRGSYLGAFKLGGQGDIARTSSVAWSVDEDTPDVASPLLSNGRLYFHKAKTGILSCLQAESGKPLFSATRVPGISTTYASPIAAGGHVYLTGRKGTTVVIKDASQFEIVATNSVGEGVDATPAVVDNQLFIRGEKHLFCISD